MKIKVFVHFVNLPGAMYIAEEMFDLFVESELINNADFNIFCNYGYNEFSWLRDRCQLYTNIQLFYPTTLPKTDFEIPTLIELKKFCDNATDEYFVLYLHHKGATKPNNQKWTTWRKELMDFSVGNWQQCVSSLQQGFDTAGNAYVKSTDSGVPHYSGNIWWARSSYIKKLPMFKLPSENNYEPYFSDKDKAPLIPYWYRSDAEIWIGMGDPFYYQKPKYSIIDH